MNLREMDLEYKFLKDWPEYQISNLGDVRRNNKPVAQFLNNHGYLCFNVSNGALRKQLRIHHEVAKAFLPKTGHLVRHLDGNKLNCCLSNIAWGTWADNEADKDRHGRSMKGERHHQHKLTAEQILEIRASMEPRLTLSRKYGVALRTIYYIRAKHSWRHLP